MGFAASNLVVSNQELGGFWRHIVVFVKRRHRPSPSFFCSGSAALDEPLTGQDTERLDLIMASVAILHWAKPPLRTQRLGRVTLRLRQMEQCNAILPQLSSGDETARLDSDSGLARLGSPMVRVNCFLSSYYLQSPFSWDFAGPHLRRGRTC